MVLQSKNVASPPGLYLPALLPRANTPGPLSWVCWSRPWCTEVSLQAYSRRQPLRVPPVTPGSQPLHPMERPDLWPWQLPPTQADRLTPTLRPPRAVSGNRHDLTGFKTTWVVVSSPTEGEVGRSVGCDLSTGLGTEVISVWRPFPLPILASH